MHCWREGGESKINGDTQDMLSQRGVNVIVGAICRPGQSIDYTHTFDGVYRCSVKMNGQFDLYQLRELVEVLDEVRLRNSDGVPADWSTGDYVVIGKGRKAEGFKVMRVEPEAVWLCPYIYAHAAACEKRWIKYTPKEMQGWVKHAEREAD